MAATSKSAFTDGGGRKNNYTFYPEDLYIEEREGYPFNDPNEARKELVEETVLNIMVYGVQQAVKITKAEIDGVERKVVIDGRRRVRHAIEANRRLVASGEERLLVECSYDSKAADDDRAFALAVTLNRHRMDDDMMENARKCHSYVNERNHTVQEAMIHFGVSRQTIADWLALVSCVPSVQNAINEGRIRPTAAIKLAKLNPVEQKVQLKDLLDKAGNKPVTVNQAKRAVAKAQGKLPEREELVAKARKAMQALTPEERTALFKEFAQESMIDSDD